MIMSDLLLYNCRILNNLEKDIIVIKSGLIIDLLNSQQVDLKKLISQAKTSVDLKNKWVTPGLIDCHTHLIFAGDRQHEFTARLEGESYQQIASQGGGINYTVAKTRVASLEDLKSLAEARLVQMLSHGVTTVEIKSGYGLNLESEVKILRVACYLEKKYPVSIQKTFLGAHCLPIDYKNNNKIAEQYINYLTEVVLPELVQDKLVDAVDGFCEGHGIGFTAEQLRPLYKKAAEYNLAIKGHTEQLSKIGGAELIAEFNGLSCDHLEYADINTVKLLRNNNITAVLLPGAYYYLNEKQRPPIDLLREYKVPIALATDFNPGTSPILSLPIIMNMACVLYNITPAEVWNGVTINAAKALGLDNLIGSVEKNKQADLVIWDCNHPNDICYYLGQTWDKTIIKAGKIINNIKNYDKI